MACVCEDVGTVSSGVKGILAGPSNKHGYRIVERCDACERFSSDEAAGLWYALVKGGTSRYGTQTRVIWCPK